MRFLEVTAISREVVRQNHAKQLGRGTVAQHRPDHAKTSKNHGSLGGWRLHLLQCLWQVNLPLLIFTNKKKWWTIRPDFRKNWWFLITPDFRQFFLTGGNWREGIGWLGIKGFGAGVGITLLAIVPRRLPYTALYITYILHFRLDLPRIVLSGFKELPTTKVTCELHFIYT